MLFSVVYLGQRSWNATDNSGKKSGILDKCVDILLMQISVPKALVGFVIGRNGEHINNIQSTCGVRLQFQNGMY